MQIIWAWLEIRAITNFDSLRKEKQTQVKIFLKTVFALKLLWIRRYKIRITFDSALVVEIMLKIGEFYDGAFLFYLLKNCLWKSDIKTGRNLVKFKWYFRIYSGAPSKEFWLNWVPHWKLCLSYIKLLRLRGIRRVWFWLVKSAQKEQSTHLKGALSKKRIAYVNHGFRPKSAI